MPFRRADAGFLAFGCLTTYVSSLGQTYFVALFAGAFAADLGLGPGAFGSLFSLATLAAGTTVVWAGGLIDRVDLRLFAAAVTLGLAAACITVATAPGWLALGLGLFLLRLFGQGLMVHTSVTAMARYYEHARGRAISLGLLGLPLGEATLPHVIVVLLGAVAWRSIWAGAAALVLLLVLPLVQLLLRGHGRRHATWVARVGSNGGDGGEPFTRRSMVADPRFVRLVPTIMAPGLILTWIFFHQTSLTAAKGWELSLFATSLTLYALTVVTTSLTSGVLVDRFGPARLLPVYLLPMGLACVLLAVAHEPWMLPLVLMLCAVSAGSSGTVVTAFWAQVYGTQNMGRVRSVSVAVGIFASALSPGLVGLMIDAGVSLDLVSLGSTAWAVGAGLLALPVARAALLRHGPSAR